MKFFRKLSIAAYFLGGIVSPLLFLIIFFGNGLLLVHLLGLISGLIIVAPIGTLISIPLSWKLTRYLNRAAYSFYKNNGETIARSKINTLARLWHIAVYLFLFSKSFQQGIEMKNPPSSRAKSTIYSIVKTCALKEVNGEVNPIFNNPKLNQYLITPSDGNCDGDENNLLTAMSQKPSKYPTYIFNMKTKEKTCTHDGSNEELHGCSAKRRGKW